jgi:two-component system NarL family sensor kinase
MPENHHGQLMALAGAAQALGRSGHLVDAVRAGLAAITASPPFGAAHLLLLPEEMWLAAGTLDLADAEGAGQAAPGARDLAPVASGHLSWIPAPDHPRAAALREAGLAGLYRVPLEWHGERLGVLEVFVRDGDDPGLAQAASIGAELFALRMAVEREDVFRAYFESAGAGIAVATSTGEMVCANRIYAQFVGKKREEIPGLNALDFIAEEYVPETVRGLERLARRETDRLDLDRRYRRGDGSLVWGRTAVTRVGNTGLIIAVVHDIDEIKRAEDAVRKLSGRLLHLQDEERRRIARSLHESAAQTVAALAMNLQRMEAVPLPPEAAQTLADSLQMVAQCSREIRTLSHVLHPPLLEEGGLSSSLRWYVQGFATRSNVAVKLELSEIGRLPMELEITLFRVVQESLSNVHRHAGAQHAIIRLQRSETDVVLEVVDDGVGIPQDVLDRLRQHGAETVGVGIAGMRERLAQLGGTLEIRSASHGTTMRARLRFRG